MESVLSSVHCTRVQKHTLGMSLFTRYQKNTTMFNWSPCTIQCDAFMSKQRKRTLFMSLQLLNQTFRQVMNKWQVLNKYEKLPFRWEWTRQFGLPLPPLLRLLLPSGSPDRRRDPKHRPSPIGTVGCDEIKADTFQEPTTHESLL